MRWMGDHVDIRVEGRDVTPRTAKHQTISAPSGTEAPHACLICSRAVPATAHTDTDDVHPISQAKGQSLDEIFVPFEASQLPEVPAWRGTPRNNPYDPGARLEPELLAKHACLLSPEAIHVAAVVREGN